MSMGGEDKEKELQHAEETATQEEHAAAAEERGEEQVEVGEKTAEELLEIGGAFLQEGKYEEAIKIYEEILKKRPRPTLPTLAKACNDCGVAYASLGQYELAIKFFNAAADLREYLIDDGISVFQNLARVYSLLGDEQKAERSRKIAEKLQKEFIRRNQEIQQMFKYF